MAFKLFARRDNPAPETTQEKTLGDPDTLSDVLLTAIMKGNGITREQALTIPAVSENIDFIANCIASMPVKLYKRKNGKVEEIEDDRVSLLNVDTGDTLDAFQMKKALVTDYFLGKGGYCYIEKNRNDVTGLYYVEDDYVVINYDYQPIYKTYSIFVGDNSYKPFEFIKLLRNTKTGAYGVSILEDLSTALETAYQTQLYQLGLVKTGGNKRGFLKSERKLGQPEINALKAAWRRLYANNTESVVVLNNGIDFKEAANTSVEMQLNESIKTLQEEIDGIFHISDDFNDTFKFAIYPIIKAFETAINRDLLLEKEKGKLFFEFDVKEIVKASLKDRYEVYRMSKECQMHTINERRRMENLNDIEGGDVIDFGLGAVLYDVNTHKYYTPNTDTTSEGGGMTPEDVKNVEEESFIDDLNGTEARVSEIRYNHNHGKDGRFTSGSGGGGGSSKSGGSKGKSGGSNKDSGSSSGDSKSGDSKTGGGGSGKDSDKNGGSDQESGKKSTNKSVGQGKITETGYDDSDYFKPSDYANYKGVEGRDYGKSDTSDALAEVKKGVHNSLENYMDENGNLTPERAALHKKIIDDYLAEKKPVEGQAEMVMMGGGPASGKSSAIDSGQVKMPDKTYTVKVDPDDIKKKLPAYSDISKQDDSSAAFYHEESSMIAKQLANASFNENYNVVYDGTGDGSNKSVEKKINGARDHGYKVKGVYVTVDTDEAVKRNNERYERGVAKGKNPRLVPEDYVRDCHAKVTDISRACADKFDSIELYDNNGPEGSTPILIATGGAGKGFTPVSGQEDKYQAFVDKGTQGG